MRDWYTGEIAIERGCYFKMINRGEFYLRFSKGG
jgi:hypothetical protein